MILATNRESDLWKQLAACVQGEIKPSECSLLPRTVRAGVQIARGGTVVALDLRMQEKAREISSQLDGEEDWPTDWRNVIIQRLKRPRTER